MKLVLIQKFNIHTSLCLVVHLLTIQDQCSHDPLPDDSKTPATLFYDGKCSRYQLVFPV